MQNETLKKLLSIIAHDLKNPFNIILGFSKELYGNIDALSPDEIAEMAKRLNTSANFAYALLENLLNFCRINMDRIEPRLELLDLEKTVGGALDPLVDSAEGKHITLNNAVKPGTIVYADKTMLMTVIRNLASNSIKFTEEYGHVWVGAEYLGSNAIINVRDNGVGMPPEKAQRLFDKDEFSSTKGTAGEPGTGLGLKVVREFVTMMNGTIEPSSEVGVGTTFIITLPAAQANP
jgi:signal transduction histidine kinase